MKRVHALPRSRSTRSAAATLLAHLHAHTSTVYVRADCAQTTKYHLCLHRCKLDSALPPPISSQQQQQPEGGATVSSVPGENAVVAPGGRYNVVVFIKGAPERIIERCSTIMVCKRCTPRGRIRWTATDHVRVSGDEEGCAWSPHHGVVCLAAGG